MLPVFSDANEPVYGTFGHGLNDDPTLGGILPGMTQMDWALLFDLVPKVHPADSDGDHVVGDFELLDYIDDWAAGQVGDFELLDAIDMWALGHYYWDENEQKFKPGYHP